jgi:trimeric autotransporter adhesin
MKQLRTFGAFIFFVICNFGVYAQVGNYVKRLDSTTTSPYTKYNLILGPNAGRYVDTAAYGPNEPDYDVNKNNTILGSYAAGNLGKNPAGTASYVKIKPRDNTYIGAFAGYNRRRNTNVEAADNDTYLGSQTGYSLQFGGNNTFLGSKVASLSDKVEWSVIIGVEAGKKVSDTEANVLIGNQSGYNLTPFNSGYNTYIGHSAGSGTDNLSLNGSENVYIGAFAGQLSTSIIDTYWQNIGKNTFVGANAGRNNKNNANTYIGTNAGLNNTNGQQNTFIGKDAGKSSTTGGNNVFIGTNSGKNIRQGTDNILIGVDAGVAIADSSVSGAIVIGNYAVASSGNAIVLGGPYKRVGIGGIPSPANTLEIKSENTNTSGLRFTNLKSTSTPSTANSLALSVDAYGDVILVPASSGGLTNPVTNLQVQSGTAGVSGLKLNNLPLSTTAAAANGKTLSVDANGNVILVTAPAGLTNPVTNLQVQSGTAGVSGLKLNNLPLSTTAAAANGKTLSVDANGNIILVTAPAVPVGADVWDQLTNGADYLIRNKNNKSVMIGAVAANKTSVDYKLYVEKGILAEKVKISANANWPDYVFAKNYSLMPLKEVETFINTNNHLPEVPSATTIEKEGLDLGKMDATLLKKVEELTLYLIEQNKKIETLQAEVVRLKSQK